ncbi:60S ribosomal protein L18 [Frankliniella fusca]|uniref:60S ribosomal protein L18 n=1 Tax=Frankliniella fusca TaxID=407009 RepID=A0AAE1HGK5_9NEOP|nr:60S ribosomal protein L18 [Frankliniella fusca]
MKINRHLFNNKNLNFNLCILRIRLPKCHINLAAITTEKCWEYMKRSTKSILCSLGPVNTDRSAE